jgi:peptide/nickel transport system substrate-binding protein
MCARFTVSLAFAGAMVLCISLVACTKVSTQSGLAGGRHPWTEPGVLRIAITQDAKTLNPLLDSTTTDGFVDRFLFEPLISADAHANPYPMLAKEIPTVENGGISKDGVIITYHLRPNMKWSDGVPVTSEDIKWSWQAIMNPADDVISRHGYDDIAAIDAPNPLTVVVHLKHPFAPFVNTFFAESDQPYGIAPAHVLAKDHDINELAFNTAPTVSDGPFLFVDWVHGDHILLRANDAFFLGRPKLKAINIQVVPDEHTAVNLLRTHTIDYIFQPSINTYQDIKTIPNVTVVFDNMNGFEGIAFNLTHPPLDDVRVRDAIVAAIDKQKLVQSLTSGQERAATEDIPYWMWAFNPDALPPPYDPQHARALLAQAGYVIGSDGIARRHGVPLRLLFVSDNALETHRKMIVLVQSMLKDVGIEADIKLYPLDILYESAALGGILHSGKFDLITEPWYSGVDPDNSSQFLCEDMPPNGYNDARYCSQEMQRAQHLALTSYDRRTRQRAYYSIEALLARDNPAVYLWWQRQQEPISVDFKGFAPNPTVESWNAWEWSI